MQKVKEIKIKVEDVCPDYWGIKPRRYYEMANTGLVPRPEKGMVDILLSAKAMIDYYRKRAEGSGSASLTDERTRLTKLDADLRGIELAEKNQEVLPYNEVKADWIKFVGATKARLLNLPSKYAPLCFGKTIAEIKEIVEGGIYQALAELAQLKYEQRKTMVGGRQHSKSTAENAGERMGRRRKNAKSRSKCRTG